MFIRRKTFKNAANSRAKSSWFIYTYEFFGVKNIKRMDKKSYYSIFLAFLNFIYPPLIFPIMKRLVIYNLFGNIPNFSLKHFAKWEEEAKPNRSAASAIRTPFAINSAALFKRKFLT